MLFKRVVVGFDGSAASVRALTAARALASEDAALVAVTVAETYFAAHAGMDAVAWEEQIRTEAEQTRMAAQDLLGDMPGAQAEVCLGHGAPTLLKRAEKHGADLICVGAHGHGRVSGVLLGSVATRVVHEARCSVLVARGSEPLDGFPRAIVVGVDSSAESSAATRVARSLARLSDAPVRELGRRPVGALVEASRSADLLVVGSRGVRGLTSVRSVAEHVAHEAECPVLIVRERTPAAATPDGSDAEVGSATTHEPSATRSAPSY
jgi:nucleotide-binding universal stress UspA family protein